MIPPRIRSVSAIDDFFIMLVYENGETRRFDVKKYLNHPAFKNLKNPVYFKSVRSAQTTVEWPNGEDIDPNDLYENSIKIN